MFVCVFIGVGVCACVHACVRTCVCVRDNTNDVLILRYWNKKNLKSQKYANMYLIIPTNYT